MTTHTSANDYTDSVTVAGGDYRYNCLCMPTVLTAEPSAKKLPVAAIATGRYTR